MFPFSYTVRTTRYKNKVPKVFPTGNSCLLFKTNCLLNLIVFMINKTNLSVKNIFLKKYFIKGP